MIQLKQGSSMPTETRDLDDWSLDEPERERWDELGELEQARLRRTYDHLGDLCEEER